MKNPAAALLDRARRAFGRFRSLFDGSEPSEETGGRNAPEAQPDANEQHVASGMVRTQAASSAPEPAPNTFTSPEQLPSLHPTLDSASFEDLDLELDEDEQTYDTDDDTAIREALDFDSDDGRPEGPREPMDSLGNSMAERMILQALGGEPDDLDDRDEFPDMHVVDTPNGASLNRR